jgi:hypothetical protein
MWNAGSKPARMIEVISPAGFEGFFRELIDMTAVGAPDPNAIAALGERYQLPFRSRSLRAASCGVSIEVRAVQGVARNPRKQARS